MAEFARVNGLACTVGTLYALNAKAFLVTVKNAGASAIDLRAEDDAVDEAVERIVKEVNPLMFFVTNSAAGTIHIVTDVSLSAADVQSRIRGLGTTVGPNNIDVTGTTVVDVQPTASLTTSGTVTFTAATA
jgi:hypothetical protein